MPGAYGTLAGRGEYWSSKREGMYGQVLRKVPMSKKKILLINPSFPDSLWGFTRIQSLVGIQYGFLPLALPTLAALTPEQFEIQLIDECVEPVDFDTPCDVVALTAFNVQSHRAFEILQAFKARGRLTALGGPFATSSPEVCRPHTDILFLGEGESIWPEFLQDFAHGHFKNHYMAREKADLTQAAIPKFDLLKLQAYGSGCIQTSRGCPFACEFCDIIMMDGRKMRLKPLENVLTEVEILRQNGVNSIFFTDANFIGNRRRAKALLLSLAEYGKKTDHTMNFSTEVSLDVAEDDELLALFQQANFTLLYIGIESPNVESLKETKKNQNLRFPILEQIYKVQSYGMIVWAGMIVGFDHDTTKIFALQEDFFKRSRIPITSLGPLVALPTTPLFTRMQHEGRLLAEANLHTVTDKNLPVLHNNGGFTNFRPKHMTINELFTGYRWLMRKLYSYPEFSKRLKALLDNMGPSGYESKTFSPNFKEIHTLFKIMCHFTFTKNTYKRKAFWSLLFHFLRSRPTILYALCSQLVMHAHIYDMVLENYGSPEEALPDFPLHD
jgi:radical SAM superfamily enzyme YgiQ (UPF0313 family)